MTVLPDLDALDDLRARRAAAPRAGPPRRYQYAGNVFVAPRTPPTVLETLLWRVKYEDKA